MSEENFMKRDMHEGLIGVTNFKAEAETMYVSKMQLTI